MSNKEQKEKYCLWWTEKEKFLKWCESTFDGAIEHGYILTVPVEMGKINISVQDKKQTFKLRTNLHFPQTMFKEPDNIIPIKEYILFPLTAIPISSMSDNIISLYNKNNNLSTQQEATNS